MNELEEHEAMHNLNPAMDKLGRDRDFRDYTNRSFEFLLDKLDDITQRVGILEGILRSKNE
jgi:hypothetical protein|tara:strand:- start:6920 stop:7102 length:183 start_codon:yes stop_codon:yes gene_type:complete